MLIQKTGRKETICSLSFSLANIETNTKNGVPASAERWNIIRCIFTLAVHLTAIPQIIIINIRNIVNSTLLSVKFTYAAKRLRITKDTRRFMAYPHSSISPRCLFSPFFSRSTLVISSSRICRSLWLQISFSPPRT